MKLGGKPKTRAHVQLPPPLHMQFKKKDAIETNILQLSFENQKH